MRWQTYPFEVFTLMLTMALTLAVCWLALTTTPQCEYDCIRVVGPGDCKEWSQPASEYHNNPDCLGVGVCRPKSGQSTGEFSHEIYDTCKTSTGKYHLQHITIVKWDVDSDGQEDTKCEALHSCP